MLKKSNKMPKKDLITSEFRGFAHRCAVVSFVFLLILAQGCNSNPSSMDSLKGSESRVSAVTSEDFSLSSMSPLAVSLVNQMNSSLNESDNYALTTEDLQLLQSSGVLDDSDQATLSQLLKQ